MSSKSKKLTLLLTSLPGYGHLGPMLSLAVGLRARGHRVVFAIPSTCAAALVDERLEHIPTADDWHETTYAFAARGKQPLEVAASIVIEKMFGDAARRRTIEVVGIVDSLSPDLVVSSSYDLAGVFAAELLGRPSVTVHTRARDTVEGVPESTIPLYRSLRHELGLPQDPEGAALGLGLNLYLMPASWRIKHFRARSREFFARPEPYVWPGSAQPDWLATAPAEMRLLVTMGTVFTPSASLVRVIREGLSDVGAQAVFAGSTAADPVGSADAPRRAFVDMNTAVASCDVCLSHGGYGPVIRSLILGKPQVVLPLAADHPLNYILCTRAGVAPRLPEELLSRDGAGYPVVKTEDLRPRHVLDAVRAASGPGYVKAAEKLASRFAEQPGLCSTLNSIEEHAT